MTAVALLARATEAGLQARLDPNGNVRLSGRQPPADLLEAMRADREAIAAELRRRELVAAMVAWAEATVGIMSDPDVLESWAALREIDG